MWRLVIETGGEACQVGLMREREIIGGWRWEWPRRHAERLVWMAAEILKLENLSWSDIGGIAVMMGPGSHTGLRVGLAAAKAWALRWGWTVYPVSLLRALYEMAWQETGLEGNILTVWQARGEEGYGHLWRGRSEEGVGEIRPLREWASVPATLVVGNVKVGERWLYVPELSWRWVGWTSLWIEGVAHPANIAALVPVYFRPFIPTQRKHGMVGSAPSQE